MKMKASQLFKIGDFRTVEVDVPEPHGQELLVRVDACGICGSDIPRIFELFVRASASFQAATPSRASAAFPYKKTIIPAKFLHADSKAARMNIHYHYKPKAFYASFERKTPPILRFFSNRGASF